ncbi:MAG: M23 family metallopeptidase [Anaerolineae bacterium]|nr:M23 family metallopeptidase [Anaerolineae bacterium]
MKRWVVGCMVTCMALAVLCMPGAAFAGPDGQQARATVSLDFQWLRQGRAGFVHVYGQDISEVTAVFQERVFNFYPEAQAYVGLISADMESDVGTHTMQVWVRYTDGTAERFDQPVDVTYGEFGQSNVTLPASMSALLEPEINQDEIDRLANITTRFTPERYWVGGFIPISLDPLIGWFGTSRLYNGTYWYRHTGIDIAMPVGTPIIATAGGRVMLSETLAIRGGYILIDHGWGIYSGYAHLSERFVVPGQWVRQGDVIGLSGMNGRSTGAHIHWEIAVGGTWVDPEDFLTLGLNEPGA